MYLSAAQCAWLVLAAVISADDPGAAPRLKAMPDPIVAASPVVKKTRHFVVQVKLIEVDEQGRETLLGEPKLQTTGGNAGMSIDHPDGRRFEFIMRLSDRLGPLASGEELIPAKTATTNQTEGVLKKLEQKIDLNVTQQPRREVLREVARRAGVGIAIDPDSVRSVAVEMELPVDLKAKDEPISTVLNRLIEPLNLGYTIKHDVILIAAAEKLLPAPEDFIFKTYEVADLVKRSIDADRDQTDFAPLIERIKTTVMPTSWERKEAAATIAPFKATLSIGVRQTAQGHAAIERLLEKIRREVPMKISE